MEAREGYRPGIGSRSNPIANRYQVNFYHPFGRRSAQLKRFIISVPEARLE